VTLEERRSWTCLTVAVAAYGAYLVYILSRGSAPLVELLGEHVGQAFLVIRGVAALLLAIVEADHLSIANVVYLCFVLAAVVGSVARVVVYRRGFRPW
jgi:hypothetical protein